MQQREDQDDPSGRQPTGGPEDVASGRDDDNGDPGAHDAFVSAESLDEPDRLRRRGIYLLPNLITTAALFSGFFAIVAAMNGQFETAALAIFVAMVLDAADGRVARLTRTESAFGAEYDSLSDMVAFGVAPALVVFAWSLQALGQIGWVATFIYMACAALRLARFNMRHDNSSFTGLASPAAAAIIAGVVWVATAGAGQEALTGPVGFKAVLLALLTATVGLLMVAPIRYWSPKLFNFKGRVPFMTLVLAVIVYAVVMVDPPRVLLSLFFLYALSGPAQWFWQHLGRPRWQAWRESRQRSAAEEDEKV